MALSRSRTWVVVYGVGLAGPTLFLGVGMLLESAGIMLPWGVAVDALVSFAVCVVGAGMLGAPIWMKAVLAVAAAAIIPLEYVVLGVVCFLLFGFPPQG